jgi:glycosyltransferase involved in cell wall biosynthesis
MTTEKLGAHIQKTDPTNISVSFVCSAFNEQGNLLELHHRCADAYQTLIQDGTLSNKSTFRMIIADNCSTDATFDVLKSICNYDSRVVGLKNFSNYGPEPSVINALKVAHDSDLIVLLCSDLQDPPELASLMIRRLISEPHLDAFVAAKRSQREKPYTSIGRIGYYKLLRLSSRLNKVPTGYHGFGCYRREIVQTALVFAEASGLSLRKALIASCHEIAVIRYDKANRESGSSSYTLHMYAKEACKAILANDATSSRLALGISLGSFVLCIVISLILAGNYYSGGSMYSSGTPTIMAIYLGGFSIQLLLYSLLSRQLENLRVGTRSNRVRYLRIDGQQDAKPGK